VQVFQPLATQRSIVRLSGERADKRLLRWREIVLSACEQCGRNSVPEVRPILSLDAWLASQVAQQGTRLLLSPQAGVRLRQLPAPTSAWLLAGPEGGLTDAEEHAAITAGWTALTLGPRVLRTETAALAAVAAMQLCWGDY
jgi:16S rRNA (uracil1498-N3)-methyltransferase